MTARTAVGYAKVAARCEKNADKCLDKAARAYAIADKHTRFGQTLVADYYMQTGYRHEADADWHRQQATLFFTYADADLPADAADAGCLSAETAVVTLITCLSVLGFIACALIGLG